MSLTAQQTVNNTTVHKADKVIVYNYVTEKNKTDLLKISKYIDLKKGIVFKMGGGKLTQTQTPIGSFYPFQIGDYSKLEAKVEKGQLLISGELYTLEGQLSCSLVNNRLTKESSEKFKQKISESFIEIVDEYNLPVFQLDLNKDSNWIEVNLITCDPEGSMGVLFHEKGIGQFSFGKPYLLLDQKSRDSMVFVVRQHVRASLKVKH